MKTLEDGWYVVINAYKFTFFEIWGDIFVLSYIACPCYPYIRVYRLYDRDERIQYFYYIRLDASAWVNDSAISFILVCTLKCPQ